MKDKILEYLEEKESAKEIIDINDFIGLTSADELYELQKELDDLVKNGIVHETKKKKYMLMKYCKSLLSGK